MLGKSLARRKSRWRKNLSEKKARELSKAICDDFGIPYCSIQYVKKIDGYDSVVNGVYYDNNPPLALIQTDCTNRIGVVIHELTHHLEVKLYDKIFNDSEHGRNYQKAKEKMVSWCRKNISQNCNWFNCLKANQNETEMKSFQL